MSNILYYSNFCDKSKRILQTLAKSAIKDELHFLCIDKRVKGPTGAWYIVLDNGEKIVMPPQVNRVPALLLLKQGHQVLYGDQILQHLQPRQSQLNSNATMNNGEPMPFSLSSDCIGGYGVASDSFSYWDQTSEELSAKGNGGMRQLYNYATVDSDIRIDAPKEDYVSEKMGAVSLEDLQQKRNSEVQFGVQAANEKPSMEGYQAPPPQMYQQQMQMNQQQLMQRGMQQQQQQQQQQQYIGNVNQARMQYGMQIPQQQMSQVQQYQQQQQQNRRY